MLDFTDAPYQFFPARPSLPVMALCRLANARWILPGRMHRIREVEVSGAARAVREIAARGERLLFLPNHATHSDPQVMTEAQRWLGTPSCYMAAYDVFLRGRFQAWLMQRAGAFSVDREGSDRKAMAEALGIIKAGRHALTIFPEGNVYMTNDKVTPFLEGAAFLGLKAQKDFGAARAVHAVPVSIKLTHLEDARPASREKLAKLAAASGERLDPGAEPVAELIRIGRHVLGKNLRQRGYLDRDEDLSEGHLREALAEGAERVLSGLERKMGLAPKAGEEPSARVRQIRSLIHQIRIDPAREAEHRVAATWADEAILAFRILGYATPYVAERPTLDRYAETVERLAEDLYNRWDPPLGPRAALVRLGEPIDLRRWLEAAEQGGRARRAASALTAEVEAAVQAGLDELNAGNRRPGAGPC